MTVLKTVLNHEIRFNGKWNSILAKICISAKTNLLLSHKLREDHISNFPLAAVR